MSTKPAYGVYTPLVTFFHEDESIDYESTKAHIKRMLEGGVTGLVLQGSNGEAPHLSHEERKEIIRTARTEASSLGFPGLQLVVGCGAPSVRETLSYLAEAKEAGADFGLVLPPAYWSAAMTPAVVEGFFSAVAEEAAMPILIYNFPGVTSGIDISSDSVIRLGKKHPGKIVGVKLTCGNLGKLQRISSTLPSDGFAPFGGKSDFFLPALVAGSNGVIAALANVAPKAHVELLRLYQSGDLKAAIALQSKLSHADWALSKVGVAGVKAVVSHFFSYGTGRGRRPLGVTTVSALGEDIVTPIQAVVEIEKQLQ
ncbi:dihydrodipicolinate synthetase family protein [Grosmannia clavigera kw1407]|uniref:Dihydrodipicolinate synthetase family protein n=1 Tax=Grosmannia clavigera (strain kw1407 / UAMH 11150) TaxID=655863 RepID=F0X9S0_GROCL|nr:dihydrodipicolinate synthetase family protein [Grosmannia clavigera kw1407]EFX05507.1 dihydrodipicolinate synthetase family protein [Grosmannia clavigera kw1407]